MNEEKFSGKAHNYSKFRPDYPDDFMEYLYSEVGLSTSSIIADIGSGTGKLTKPMLIRGSFVYAIEPNEDMRSSAIRKLSSFDKFRSTEASAEATGLPDKSVDFITVGQAFHWFDADSFKAECQRILKPDGKVILVWNSRDHQSEIIKEIDAINRLYIKDYKGFSGGMLIDKPDVFESFFKGARYEKRIFKTSLELDEDGFVGVNLSSSYSPKKDDDNYTAYEKAVRQIFQKFSVNGYYSLHYVTQSYVGEV